MFEFGEESEHPIGLGLTNSLVICKALGGKIKVQKNKSERRGLEVVFSIRVDHVFYKKLIKTREESSVSL